VESFGEFFYLRLDTTIIKYIFILPLFNLDNYYHYSDKQSVRAFGRCISTTTTTTTTTKHIMSSPTPVVVSSVHYLPVGSVRSIITLNKSASSAITLVTKKNVGTSNCRRSSLSLQQQQQLSSSMSHDNNQQDEIQ
jgi:hypothetical protein